MMCYYVISCPYALWFVEFNPNLRSIELTKLLENYARNTKNETEYVE